MMQHSVLKAAALSLSASLLGACSLMQGAPPVQPVVAVPPPPPPLPVPTASHRFEIDSEKDDLIGILQVTRARQQDTLSDIARRFNVGYEELVRANPKVDPWLPGEGREIVIPTRQILPNAPREGIVINTAAMRLYYFPKRQPGQKQVVYTHPIGIGKVGWATPEGTTKVVRKAKNPTWRPGAGVRAEHRKNGEILPAVVPPGPDNPLGTRAMYLGWPTYLIHGTNKPAGVGLRSSHGCIRLYPEDVESIFEMIEAGEKVTVVNQPFVFGWHEGHLYLQAYDVLEDDPRDWKKAQKKLLSRSLARRIQAELKARDETVNWDAVSLLAHDPRGVPVPISLPGASIESVLAAAPRVRNSLPSGATWNGEGDVAMDNASFRELLSDSDPQAPSTPAGRGGPART
jgi:L,D-transpeptidase ErfK/SrfK